MKTILLMLVLTILPIQISHSDEIHITTQGNRDEVILGRSDVARINSARSGDRIIIHTSDKDIDIRVEDDGVRIDESD